MFNTLRKNSKNEQPSRQKKSWNIVGICDPEKHFTVPFQDDALLRVVKEPGTFVALYSHRQGGKSTRLKQLEHLLRNDKYMVIYVDFSLVSCTARSTDGEFYVSLGKRIMAYIREYDLPTTLDLPRTQDEFQEMFTVEGPINLGKRFKGIVLLFDEMDRMDVSKLDLFWAPIVGMLTDVNTRKEKASFNLISCVGAGVHRVKRISDPHSSAAPPNKKVDMISKHFTKEQVSALFREFSDEYSVKLSESIVDRIYHATGGHPGLVCKIGAMIQAKVPKDSNEPFVFTLQELFKILNGIIVSAPSEVPLNDLFNALLTKEKNELGEALVILLKQYLITGQPISTRENTLPLYYGVDKGILHFVDEPNGEVDFVCPIILSSLLPVIMGPDWKYDTGNKEQCLAALYSKDSTSFGLLLKEFIACINLHPILNGSKKYQGLNNAQQQREAELGLTSLPTEACYHFQFHAFLSHVTKKSNIIVYCEHRPADDDTERVDIYLSNGVHFPIEIGSGIRQDKFVTKVAQTEKYRQDFGDDFGIFVLFTTIPKDLWSNHFKPGLHDKVHTFIVYHKPDLSEWKIYDRMESAGELVIPKAFQEHLLAHELITRVQSIHLNKDVYATDKSGKPVFLSPSKPGPRRISELHVLKKSGALFGTYKVTEATTFDEISAWVTNTLGAQLLQQNGKIVSLTTISGQFLGGFVRNAELDENRVVALLVDPPCLDDML